tara:strand:+ start:274 stop:666 length:393 start_codon:yes stop_codon:yes gene_type:complete
MATRSNSNKGVSPNSTNGSSYSTGRNPGGMVKGLAKGVTYGEGEKLKQQANLFGMPNAPSPNVQNTKRPSPNIDVFSETEFVNEPVTSGLPFGPGSNGPENSQTAGVKMVKEFIYDSWLATGDDSLLEYL